MNSIPASELVNVIPGVLGAGGNPLSLNAIFLTEDTSVPMGSVLPFSTLDAVQDYFGATSPEANLAGIYFRGFTNCNTLPGTLYFAQYNTAAVAAYLRGASIDGMTLAQLQALSGTIIVTINGEIVTTPNIDLSGATSFSNAAALITAGLQNAGATFTGVAEQTAADDVLEVTAVTSGSLHVGDVLTGTGVDVGLAVLAQLTGPAGGIGTYTVTTTTGFTSTAVSVAGVGTATYDAQLTAFVITSPTTGVASTIGFAAGTLAPGLKLRAADGAVVSQGADIAVPAELMAGINAVTQNWATFMTVVEVDLDVKLEFADWVNDSNQRYLYVCQDSDATALAANATGSFGFLVKEAEFNGVCPMWSPSAEKAAFICGATAAIDFQQANGRITYAFKGLSGLTADITDATVADNLVANGYNFYGAYATANDSFVMLQPGSVPGVWTWIDPYVNQIYLNSQLQLAFMSLLTQVKSIPYNEQGYSLLRAAALDPISEALNFGSIRAGVQLSASQIAQVNLAAGAKIDGALFQSGFYLQILPATAQVRENRESPPMTLWYTDGGSIQRINLASIDVM